MNLRRMRRTTTAKLLRVSPHHTASVAYPDQDALKTWFCRRTLAASGIRAWNAHVHVLRRLKPAGSSRFRANRLPCSASIPTRDSFIGRQTLAISLRHPRRDLYFEHARQTSWERSAPTRDGNLLNAILRRLPRLRIDRCFELERRMRAGRQRYARSLAPRSALLSVECKHAAISIVLPTYKSPRTLARAIQSVARQTFDDFEAESASIPQ